MATVVKDLGAVTAYAYAVAGGYSGTEAEFEALLGNIAEDLSEIENLSVTVTTLPAGSSATASYNNGVLSLGIPKGDKGDKGDTGATGATGPQGIPGDVANLASDYSTSSTYGVGDYCIYNSQLYRCITAITTAEAWTAAHWTAAVLGDDVSDLQSALNTHLLENFEWVNPTNWFNADGLVAGELLADGTISDSTTRKYTDYFIPVTEGSYVWYNRGDNFAGAYMRHLTAYDENKNVLSAKGSDSSGAKYLVKSGVAFVKVTIDNPSLSVIPMITVGANAPTVYSAYFDPYEKLTKDYLTETSKAVVDKLKSGTMNSLDLANRYACSMPLTKFRQTVGFAETFYGKTARTPDETTFLSVSVGGDYQERVTADNTRFPNAEAYSSVNGFYWRMYDSAYAEMYNNLTQTYASGQPRSIIAKNLASCTLLAIGDSTVDHDVMTQKMLDAFAESGATLTLIGTLGSGNNKNEGRAGWKASDYLTDRTYDGVVNPFYNPIAGTFDFEYYMNNQEFATPDFVVIQLGINDLGSTRDYAAIWACITHMITSILAYNASIKILLNLPTTPTSNQALIQSAYLPEYKNRVVSYDAFAETHSLAEYGESKVRCSYCHIILDPDNDIRDNVHPTDEGYEKMALEVVNQINHWQNGN